LSISLAAFDEEPSQIVASCTTPCTVDIPPGPYRLSFPATNEWPAGVRRRVVLDRDGKLVVTPRSPVTPLMVTGAVLTPTGWVMFAVSHSPTVRLEPNPVRATASFGVVPLRGGAGIGGTFVF
jgi:hypothetical protein